MNAPAPSADDAEWLEPDGLGGFASGTVCGIRTRCYHALLLAATEPPTGRMVLVNGFDAEVATSAGAFAISTQRYLPGVNAPDGVSRLESFTPDPWPRWTFRLPGGATVTQEIFVPRESAIVVLRWSASGVTAPAQLRVRPFFSGRDFHALHHANAAFDFLPANEPGGQRWNFYPGVPAVQARHNGAYRHDPLWYRNFLYDQELERGLDATEDLAAPGEYLFDLSAGPAVLIFSAEVPGAAPFDGVTPAADLAEKFARGETARRAAFATPRLRAAEAYLVKRGAGRTIIAGYPWFADWGRDTFISLRGLCLATGRRRDARDILLAWAGTVSEGMLPNRFPDTGDTPEYNSVDASLWYVIAVYDFLEAARGDADLLAGRDRMLAAVGAILAGYTRGTRFGIGAEADGLLACGVPGVQLTWMDALVDGWVVTPRIGKPVEVQALWLNALALGAETFPPARDLFARGRASFERRFWNEARGCLFDVADVDHVAGAMDDRLRPNQLFAVGGLPLSFFEGDRARRVVETARDRLWTPLGPRSLAPGEKDYAPHYVGDRLRRDGAYHQGTVWPWLAGPFLEAWVRAHGSTAAARAEAAQMLRDSELLRPDLQGLHHVPEIADAEPPHTARGCPFQAWSLGEVLRLERKILAAEFKPET